MAAEMTYPISRKRPLRRNRSASGFTLIELALVTVIILVVMGLSAPIFRRTFSDLIIKDAAYSVSKMIGYAQERSIIERKLYRVRFDEARGTYDIQFYNEDVVPPVWQALRGRFGRPYKLPDTVSFGEGTRKQLICYPDGQSDKATIRIMDKRGNGYVLEVKGFGSAIETKAAAEYDEAHEK